MGKINFKDSITTKTKHLDVVHTDQDIIINLPDKSGYLLTDLSIDKNIQNIDLGLEINKILKPDITENNGGITDEDSWDKPLKIASYRTSPYFVGKHTSTDWEAFGTENMEEPLDTLDSTTDESGLTSWLPNVAEDNKEVYVRYRFRSNEIMSPWSDLLHYTTPPYGIRPVTITVSDNKFNPTISTSKFIAFGEDKVGKIEHRSTSWKVKDSTNNTVFSSLDDETNLTSITLPKDTLTVNETYTVEVVFNTNNIRIPRSKTNKYSWLTIDIHIEKPELAYEYTGGKHIVRGSKFIITNSDELHTATWWRLVCTHPISGRIVRYDFKGNKDFTSLDITSLILATGVVHTIECIYYSTNFESNRAMLRLVPVVSSTVPTEFTMNYNSSNCTAVMRFSTYEIANQVDKVKAIAYRIYNKTTEIESFNELDTRHAGKYREAMEIPFSTNDIFKMFGYNGTNNTEFNHSPAKIPNVNEQEIEVEAYIVGDKFNSELFKTTFKPDIRVIAETTVDARDLSKLSIKPNTFNSNLNSSLFNSPVINPIFKSYLSIWNKQYNSLLVYKQLENKGLGLNPDMNAIPMNGGIDWHIGMTPEDSDPNNTSKYRRTLDVVNVGRFRYNEDYIAELSFDTPLGKVYLPKKEFYIPLGIIDTPIPRVTIEPISNNEMYWIIENSNYVYTPANRENNDQKDTVWTIKDDTGKLITTITIANARRAETTFQYGPDAKMEVDTNKTTRKSTIGRDLTNLGDPDSRTIKIRMHRALGVTYGRNYTLGVQYSSNNQVKSKEAVINVNTGAVPAVIINTPTVVAETDFDNKIVKARITNTFNVKYLEDDRHMTTTWILKYGDSIVWQSNGDPVHLLSYDIPLTEILYDKDYTLEVYWTASNNQDSARGYAREFMIPFGNLKYFNIRMLVRIGTETYSLGDGEWTGSDGYWSETWVDDAYYDIIIYKWPPELEIISTRALWFRNSDIRYRTSNSNVTSLVNNVKKYAEPYAHIVNSEGYTGPDSIPAFRIGTTRYSQIDDSGATIWVTFKNKKTGKTNEIAFGASKSWKIGYGRWVDVRMRYNWIKDINAVVMS